MNQSKAVQFGIIAGIFSIITQTLMYVFFVESSVEKYGAWSMISMASLFILIVILVVAINAKKTEQAGYISFKQAVKQGFTVVTVSSVIGFVYTLLCRFILFKPSFARLKEIQLDKLIDGLNKNATEEQIDQAISFFERFYGLNLWIQLPMSLIMGFIIVIIVAAILQRKDPNA